MKVERARLYPATARRRVEERRARRCPPGTLREKVLGSRCLGEVTAETLIERFDCTREIANTTLSRLARAGRISKVSRGAYLITARL